MNVVLRPISAGAVEEVVVSCWGRGYATDAVRALLDRARDVPAIERVVASTPLDRPASGRVLEKAGFTCVGEDDDEHEAPRCASGAGSSSSDGLDGLAAASSALLQGAIHVAPPGLLRSVVDAGGPLCLLAAPLAPARPPTGLALLVGPHEDLPLGWRDRTPCQETLLASAGVAGATGA